MRVEVRGEVRLPVVQVGGCGGSRVAPWEALQGSLERGVESEVALGVSSYKHLEQRCDMIRFVL